MEAFKIRIILVRNINPHLVNRPEPFHIVQQRLKKFWDV